MGLRNGNGTIETWTTDEATGDLKGLRSSGVQIYGDWEDEDKVEYKAVPPRNDWLAEAFHEIKKWKRVS